MSEFLLFGRLFVCCFSSCFAGGVGDAGATGDGEGALHLAGSTIVRPEAAAQAKVVLAGMHARTSCCFFPRFRVRVGAFRQFRGWVKGLAMVLGDPRGKLPPTHRTLR